jgi:hypothetical protein
MVTKEEKLKAWEAYKKAIARMHYHEKDDEVKKDE